MFLAHIFFFVCGCVVFTLPRSYGPFCAFTGICRFSADMTVFHHAFCLFVRLRPVRLSGTNCQVITATLSGFLFGASAG